MAERFWVFYSQLWSPTAPGRLFRLFSGDSAGRTYTLAGAAVQTCIRIDDKLAVSLADCFSRAFACTGSARYAFIRNYICHYNILLCGFIVIVILVQIYGRYKHKKRNFCFFRETLPGICFLRKIVY